MSRYEDVLAALDDCGVRFVVVGGLAVVLHGYLRQTVDVDLVIDLTATEAAKAMTCLTDLGLEPRLPVAAEGFADPAVRGDWIRAKGMRVFSFFDPRDELFELDVFVEYPLPFEDLVADAKIVDLGGFTIRVASIDHLIAMKRVAGRTKDLADIEELEALRDAE